MTSPTTAAAPRVPSRTPESLLDRLRRETAAQHRELEATVDITARLAAPESYRQLLAAFYGFYAPLELQLRRAAPTLDAMHGRFEKCRWLAEDLAQLGVADPTQLPRCRSFPRLDNRPRVLGTMYVIEGSTLGGRHISALLDAGAAADMPRRFFTSYGSEVGTMWRSFVAQLNELTAPADHDIAAENARATFDSMREWLREQA